MILGCPGSGKSTLAETLSKRTGLPLIHLDQLWWKPDRTHISRDEFDCRLKELLSEDRWIIDGDYSRTYEARIRSCDTVIFLDYDAETCMSGIRERVGRKRADLPWTEHQTDPELIEEVRNYSRDNRPAILRLLEQYPDRQALIFQSRDETDRWLSENRSLRKEEQK